MAMMTRHWNCAGCLAEYESGGAVTCSSESEYDDNGICLTHEIPWIRCEHGEGALKMPTTANSVKYLDAQARWIANQPIEPYIPNPSLMQRIRRLFK